MKSYLITDPSYYHDLESFENYLQEILNKYKPDFACFRDKTNRDIYPYAKLFLNYCKRAGVGKSLINTHIDIAKELHFDGVHLTSSQADLITLTKKSTRFVIVSTHSLDEALFAQKMGADAVTISPVFSSPGKGKKKGVKYLKKFNESLNIKVFALGGIITKEQVSAISSSRVYGFASIRYFV